MSLISSSSQVRSEIKELGLLFEISTILDSSLHLQDVVQPVLETIGKHMGIKLGLLGLLNRTTQRISIEVALGLSESQRKKGRYKIGEGITGRVIESGEPAIVPRIADEPSMVHRTGAVLDSKFTEMSFICVPIKVDNSVIGSLSTDKLFSKTIPFEEDVRLLSIIASMVSQAVKLRQAADEENLRLLKENDRLQEQLKTRFNLKNLIGNSEAMDEVFRLISQVTKSDATVLIRGETGTGKDLVANAIHYNSERSDRAFIKVNCAALPESVIESELFGHERGAFTGAITTRKGRFEIANGGSIFLDEIGDLTPTTQVKLLRVLQEHEFERVGGNTTHSTDVRVIAATNRNLEELISKDNFRSDLYYRLNVFPIHIPPLRERKTDLLLLADHFVTKYGAENNKAIKRVSTPAIDMFMSYHWPGNVRELENCIERAVLLSNDDVIHGHHLPPTLQTANESGTETTGNLQGTLTAVERELIQDALKLTNGNISSAAKKLEISERIIGLRIRKYKINPARYK